MQLPTNYGFWVEYPFKTGRFESEIEDWDWNFGLGFGIGIEDWD